ncbi:MAG: hypothetical protein JJU11_12745 [Candidatus Sumerlaeia bacterium]|nr:hypothetical protein [Candidatus Sumerlaeia bacterium]
MHHTFRFLCLTTALTALTAAPGIVEGDTLSWRAAAHTSPGPTALIQMNGTAIAEVDGNRFAYSFGGNTGPTGMDIDSIWYAPIEGEEIGPWKKADATLDGKGIVYHTRSTVAFNGRLYVVGGRYNAGDGFDTRYDGIRVFEPDATGNIPANNVTLYTGTGDGESIPDVAPSLDLLEMAAVITPSRVHPGDALLRIMGGGDTNAVRSFRIDGSTGRILGAGPGGELAPAVTQEENLPQALAFAAATIHQDRIYFLGGHPVSDKVYFTTIGDDDRITSWRETTAPLPEGRFDGAAASFGANLYFLGGTAGTNEMTRNEVLRAVVDEEGDIIDWILDTPLPMVPGVRRVGTFTTNDAIYLMGGRQMSYSFNTAVWIGTTSE